MSRRARCAAGLLTLGLAAFTQVAMAAGSGAFVAHPITPGFGVAGDMVKLADLNGDGRLDAVVASAASTAIFISDGSGNFSPHPGAPTLAAGGTVALGDVNGDGRIDIVISGSVFLGTVTGFSSNGTFGSGGYVALGDVDGDGDLDALLGGTVWLNNGAGSFSAHPTAPTFSAVPFTSVNLGDLDGDGKLDAVATGDQLVYVFMNDGSGTFTPHPTVPTFGTPAAGKTIQQAALGDVDGDGDLDVLAALTDSGGASTNLVLRNGGTGNLTLLTSFAGNSRVALADVDGDGDRDALTNTSSAVWRNSGAGAFTAHPTPTDFGASVTSFALGDLDGDGDLDAVASNNPGSTTVWLNVNAGTFNIVVSVSPSGGGTASCSPNPVTSGGSSTCTATANAGFAFANWSGDCTGSTCALNNVTSARSVTANFTQNAYAITTAANPSNGGTVSCTNNPVSHGGSSTCTATANAGFTFTNWSGDCSGSNCTLAGVTSTKSVTANFTGNSYPVTVSVLPSDGGTASCSPNPVPHGGNATCTATANPGFAFTGWTGACSGPSCTLSSVTGPKSVTAGFVPLSATGPPRLGNISTRGQVLTGDNVLIAGFIIEGSSSKTVVVRARGPSLNQFGVTGLLANPQMQLFSGQAPVGFNDDWQQASNAAQLQASGFAPSDAMESAILVNLAPGAYSAIVSGVGGTTGVAIVEVFEVDATDVPLVNIATRGRVETGDNVLIAGITVQGNGPKTVVLRARGPSLAQFGVTGLLANPQLQLFTGQAPTASNDNWQQAPNAADIQAAGFAPSDPNESAIMVTLQPGAYTAIVSGVGGSTGVAIVEVFAVP